MYPFDLKSLPTQTYGNMVNIKYYKKNVYFKLFIQTLAV